MMPGLSGNMMPLRSLNSTRGGFSRNFQLSASSPRVASVGSQESATKACLPPRLMDLDRSAANSVSVVRPVSWLYFQVQSAGSQLSGDRVR